MTPEELNKILATGENVHHEFKKARNNVPVDLYDTICSFLNREGGTIILGVDDDGIVQGIDEDAMDQVKKDIVSAMNNKDVMNPPVNFPVCDLEKDGKQLLYIRIPVSSQVHNHNGIIYDREHDSDIRITDNDRIAEIYFRKRQDFTENKIYPALTMNDLEKKLFDKSRALIHSVNTTHPWLEENDETILRRSLFYRKDFRTSEEGLTLAAALIFGKDETIRSILPAYKVDALVRIENTDRWDDRLVLRTNLIDTYQQLMVFIKRYLPDKFFTEGDQRKDLREVIFREIVGNIIVHREYTNARPTELIIYKDRVEATNPNKVIFRGLLELDTFCPYPKNPNIRKFFSEFSWTDEIGSGVKNVNKYLQFYANGAKPLFIEDDEFKTVIPLMRHVIGGRASTLFEFAGLSITDAGEEAVNALMDVTFAPFLLEIEDTDELLYKMGLSWHEKGVKFDKVRFLINNKIGINSLEKELSIEKKGVKLLKKRGLNLLKILILLLNPKSLEDLMKMMEFKSKGSFRDDYIVPLRDNKLIDLTIPEKISDPKQQYKTSERGKLFLGGF